MAKIAKTILVAGQRLYRLIYDEAGEQMMWINWITEIIIDIKASVLPIFFTLLLMNYLFPPPKESLL